MITLHYFPGNASLAPHLLLRELGLPFELALVDRNVNAHKSAGYLKLNPNGLIPVLVDGDLVLYETAAILLHLADHTPEARVAPPLGSAERAAFYKWLFWLSNTVQATMAHYFYPHRMVNDGNADGAAQVKAHAEQKLGGCFEQIDALLGSHRGPWLLGETFSAADPLAFMLCRWSRGFASKPARYYAAIGPYLKRMLDRPAVQRVFADEKLPQPFV